MAYKPRYTKKRNTRRMTKYKGYRAKIARSRLNYVPKIHFHKVTAFSTDALSPQPGPGSPAAYSYVYGWDTTNNTPLPFMLSQLPNVAEFQALYDVYKILMVAVSIIPAFNTQIPANTLESFPGLHSVLDYNDSTSLTPSPTAFQTNLDEIVQYSTYRYTRGGRLHKRVIKPRVQESVQSTTGGGALTTVSGIEGSRRWIDTEQSDVRHYGITVMSDQLAAEATIKWTTKVTYYLAFKNTK